MPLQHTQEHEEQPAPLAAFSTNAVQETMQEATPSSGSNVASDAPRYDAAAVKQIIALAEQMQSHHRQTLTPNDIEALGHEVGVEPEFIRRALAQINTSTAAGPNRRQTSPQTGYQGGHRVTEMREEAYPFRLTRKQNRLLMVPLALYFLLLPYTLNRIDPFGSDNLAVPLSLYIAIPAVLTLYLGIKGKSYRLGIWAGALMGLTAAVSFVIANDIRFHSSASGDLLNILSQWIGAGMALGLVGSATGKAFRRVRLKSGQRRRLRVRVVMETAE